ncbi:hypothetical protein EOM39_06840 [Candidatus Gracilibacteria bacterium]|nr:hypothetical protein [Candidatus Gracilibacteria bacterium]
MNGPQSKIGFKIFSIPENQNKKNEALREKGTLQNEVFSLGDKSYVISSGETDDIDANIEDFKNELLREKGSYSTSNDWT